MTTIWHNVVEWDELNAQSESMWQIPQVNVCHKFNCILLSRSYKRLYRCEILRLGDFKGFFGEFCGKWFIFYCFMGMEMEKGINYLNFRGGKKFNGFFWKKINFNLAKNLTNFSNFLKIQKKILRFSRKKLQKNFHPLLLSPRKFSPLFQSIIKKSSRMQF